jgi:hypothetical protein
MDNALLLLYVLVFAFFLAATIAFFRMLQRFINRRRWLYLIIGNTLLFFTLLSSAVLAGELYFRYFYDDTDFFGLSRTTES